MNNKNQKAQNRLTIAIFMFGYMLGFGSGTVSFMGYFYNNMFLVAGISVINTVLFVFFVFKALEGEGNEQ